MTTRTKFILFWTGGGLVGACLLLGLAAPFILWWFGDVDEQTSRAAKLTYTFVPMLPFAAALICLLLSWLGKLPGTKAH